MKQIVNINLFVMIGLLCSSCNLMDRVEQKATEINNYEVKALHFAKENTKLKIKISQLRHELETLLTQNEYLHSKINRKNTGRSIASIPSIRNDKDLVQFEVYRWSPKQLSVIGDKSFKEKQYEKSAQFYRSLLINYSDNSFLTEKDYLRAGIAAYESGSHPDWVIDSLNKLITEYPASIYYRNARLWIGLTKLQSGDNEGFFAVVNEFRDKYQNTKEWEILSGHYESILQRYNN